MATALTTGLGWTAISNPRQGGGQAAAFLRGQPFDCSNWTENSGASLVMPNTNMDVPVPFLGIYDIGQALRMNDD